MEFHSESNRILCSFDSATLLREQDCKFSIDRRGKIRPKGKREMLVYWIGERSTSPDELLLEKEEETKNAPPPESPITDEQ